MTKIINEMTPQELNSFLIIKYNVGLHQFALILLYILKWGDITRFESEPDQATLLDIRKKLKNLKKKIISVMVDCDYRLFSDPIKKRLYKKDLNEAEKTIIEVYKLESFFRTIDRILRETYIITKLRHPGAPIKKTNLISSSWAHLISDSGHKIEWDMIADLLEWFWEKLKSYEIYEELIPEGKESDPEYMRIQFYRNKKRVLNFYKEMKNRWGEKNWLDMPGIVYLGKETFNIRFYGILELDISKIEEVYDFYEIKLYKDNFTSPLKIIFPDGTYLK